MRRKDAKYMIISLFLWGFMLIVCGAGTNQYYVYVLLLLVLLLYISIMLYL